MRAATLSRRKQIIKEYFDCVSRPDTIGDRVLAHLTSHRVVVGDDLLFASVLHYDLQQARAEATLVIRIRSGRQLLNPSHRREHFHDGNIRPETRPDSGSTLLVVGLSGCSNAPVLR